MHVHIRVFFQHNALHTCTRISRKVITLFILFIYNSFFFATLNHSFLATFIQCVATVVVVAAIECFSYCLSISRAAFLFTAFFTRFYIFIIFTPVLFSLSHFFYPQFVCLFQNPIQYSQQTWKCYNFFSYFVRQMSRMSLARNDDDDDDDDGE